ncbi:MAG: hypothetical protein ACR2QM_09465 [Longimicrobiales bacterium]
MTCDPAGAAILESQADALKRLARIERVDMGAPADGGVGASAVLSDGTEVFLPLEDLIDLGQERDRLTKEIDRLKGQLKGTNGKLANENFTAKAPAEVVERERSKAAAFEEQIRKLEEKRAALGGG